MAISLRPPSSAQGFCSQQDVVQLISKELGMEGTYVAFGTFCVIFVPSSASTSLPFSMRRIKVECFV
jgi:hypothetical protein